MFPSAPANLHRRRPLHHTLCVSLPRYREGGKRSRFRGAAASELCNEAERIFSLQKKGGEASKDAPSIGRARASPDEAKRNRATTTKEKGSGTPTNVCPTSASRDAARTLSLSPPPLAGEDWEGARSPVGVPPRLLRQRANADAQLQARLPGTRQDARSCKLAPTGEQRPCASSCMIRKSGNRFSEKIMHHYSRALPAPACPSPGNAPPRPVIVPAG